MMKTTPITGIRPEDIKESAEAAQFLRAYLDGEMVDPTKPPENEAHQFRPIHIKLDVDVKSEHEGGILQVSIKQADIHHPDLVRDMLIKRFAGLPETAPYPISYGDIDYNLDNASFTVKLKLPKGKADDIIHALSLKAEKTGITQQEAPNWAARLQRQPNPEPKSWVSRLVDSVTDLFR